MSKHAYIVWVEVDDDHEVVRDGETLSGQRLADHILAERLYYEEDLPELGSPEYAVWSSGPLPIQLVDGTGFDRNATFVRLTDAQRAELLAAAQEAEDAAKADSNDEEIDALREALEFALGLLGIDLPEGRRVCDECEALLVDPDDFSSEHAESCSLHPDNTVDA